MPTPPNYHLSERLLEREDFKEACANHDFESVFNLIRQWQGFSQNDIAAAVGGGLSQSRVSKIMNGHEKITTFSVIVRVADAFYIPGIYLGLANRPWETTPAPVAPAAPLPAPSTAATAPLPAGPGPGSPAVGDLAQELGVDATTVRRWLNKGRQPHADATADAEVMAFYPHRSQVPKNYWLEHVMSAKERIDVLTFASLFLPEDNPEAVEVIKHKAATGVKVRFALGDPDSPELALRGREERLYDAIPGRVRMALAYYRPLVGVPGIEFHLHRTTLYNSIFRFDDQMLVNQHIYGTYGYCAPILHLQQVPTSDLFDTYEKSFELAWSESYDYEPPAS